MFYESHNSFHGDSLKIEMGKNFSFPSHLHSSFEFITVMSGEMVINVDKKQYVIRTGEALLIFPNQVHSLETPEHSSHCLCIFSPKLVQGYSDVFLTKHPKDHKFCPNPFYVAQLSDAGGFWNSLRAKGLLYSLCAEFDSCAEYEDRDNKAEDLLPRIFRFVEANFKKTCTLEALSESTSYHSVYLSRYFKRCTGLSYTDYVNRYRVNEARYILKNIDQSILQTAYDCGFESLRNFNRCFKKITGMTPSEYRAKREA